MKLPNKVYYWMTKINPNMNIMVRYFLSYKKFFPMKKPVSIIEKDLYLRMKYYNTSSLVAKCADKVRVREYLRKKGYAAFLNEIYGVYDTVDEFFSSYGKLPETFVMKWNFGCGYNIICDGKGKIDRNAIKQQMENWGGIGRDVNIINAEMQYCNYAKKILVEKYLGADDGSLPNDYKLYCFDGMVKAVLVISDRNTEMRAGFYDMKWEYHDVKNYKCKPLKNAVKPCSLDKMVECAESLSNGIPFVRIDFYEINGKPVFGEMTFSPAAGFYVADADIDGHSMGDYIDLRKDYPLLH